MKHINDIPKETPKEEKKEGIPSPYIDKLQEETSKGKTKNDALTYTQSGSNLLDFYAQAGAMRQNPEQALDLFQKAFAEDRLKAIKILFYLRDIRGGQGERTLFRICLEWLGSTYPEIFEKIIEYVPEYGRYDDIFFDNDKCFTLIKKQLESDIKSETPSLLAKWLPTINASSPTTRAKAKFMAQKLKFTTEIVYRKTLAKLRKTIKIVETQMSSKKWEDIDYSTVPSQASRIYRNAFRKHDEERYNKFIEKAETGEVKINAGTLYPHQIYKTVEQDYSKTLEALWNQLPDYTQGKNALVVADVSGSMIGNPMAVSVSLALYFAERNKGQFKDYFMTFSAEPKLQKIVGKTLKDKMNSIQRSHWEMNTDIQAIFDILLETAIENKTPKEELPETIYIISDMEFDQAIGDAWQDIPDITNYELIKKKYNEAKYPKPNLVFWNVNASGKNVPVRMTENGVALVSGFSPVIFSIALENKTPEEVMLDTLNSDRYKDITI